jgi:TatD DNase family protein
MKFFDSHCHLDLEPLSLDSAGAIERAYKSGVEKMINIGSSLRGSAASIQLANNYPNIWASIGIHPHDAETEPDVSGITEKLLEMAQNDKVIAVGEIGLDYFNFGETITHEQKEAQKKLFVAQLDIASELKLPVIIHTRDAEEDTLKLIRDSRFDPKKWGGAIHCYTGSVEFVEKLLSMGFYIGFTGFITFEQEKFNHIREAVKKVPLDKILIETDAPFLAPEPFRGKTNEPAYVVEVAKKISELKGDSLENIAQATYKNTEKLFNI